MTCSGTGDTVCNKGATKLKLESPTVAMQRKSESGLAPQGLVDHQHATVNPWPLEHIGQVSQPHTQALPHTHAIIDDLCNHKEKRDARVITQVQRLYVANDCQVGQGIASGGLSATWNTNQCKAAGSVSNPPVAIFRILLRYLRWWLYQLLSMHACVMQYILVSYMIQYTHFCAILKYTLFISPIYCYKQRSHQNIDTLMLISILCRGFYTLMLFIF